MSRPEDREDTPKVSRRRFLSPLVLATLWGRAGLASQNAGQPGDALLKVTDLAALQSFLTENENFYIRNHFATSRLSLPKWRLSVTGQVGSSRVVSYAELLRQPARSLTVTLECAGNGVGSGGVSTATWTGIPLVTLLEQAGLSRAVKYIRLVGADSGVESPSPLPLAFARSIPLEKALHPDTLLAPSDERLRFAPRTRLPLAWYRSRMVRHGFSQMADAYRSLGPFGHWSFHD